jgi:hypothetical protein
MSSECLALPAVQAFLEFALALLQWLVRLGTLVLLGLASWMALRQLLRQLFGTAAFLEGAIDSPDLALQFVGRHADAMAQLAGILKQSGHLPLLRNLVLDSRVFVPVYTASFIVAILFVIGLPFTCGRCTISLPALAAVLLTWVAAVLDWLENGAIARAIRLNGQPSAERKKHEGLLMESLIQANRRSSAKFALLGIVLLMLGWHATPPAPIFGLTIPTPQLFLASGALMLIGTVRLRLLETGIAIAGLGVVAFFFVLAWR